MKPKKIITSLLAITLIGIVSTATITHNPITTVATTTQTQKKAKTVKVTIKIKYYDTKKKKNVVKKFKTYKVKKGSKFGLSYKKLPKKAGNTRVSLKAFKVTKNVTKTVKYKKIGKKVTTKVKTLGEKIANEAKKLVGRTDMVCGDLVEKSILKATNKNPFPLEDGWIKKSPKYAYEVSKKNMQQGDIIVYKVNHMAIYIGNGKAVHGGWNGTNVVISSKDISGNYITQVWRMK